MTLEQLQVVIQANTDQFKSELLKIQGMLTDLDKTSKASSKNLKNDLFGAVVGGNIVSGIFAKTMGVLTGAIEGFIGQALESANVSMKFESALIGLETVAGRRLGQDAIPKATQAAKDLAEDGLMTVTESASGLKNLLASGFSLPEAIDLMNTFKNSAAFGRQSSLKFGEAIVSATEGVKNGNSILVDNAGITKNLSVLMKEQGKSQQDVMNIQSDASARQAIYNGLMKEGNIFAGDAIKLANTRQGQLASIGSLMKNIQTEIGQALKPIQLALQGGVVTFLQGIMGSFASAENGILAFTNRVAGYIVALIRVIGRLLSMLPGVGGAFNAMANFSLSAGKKTDGLAAAGNSAAKGLSNAAGGAKKLKKELGQLAGFDEMQVLNQQDNGGAGGAGGAGGGFAGNLGELSAGIDDSSSKINEFADNVFSKFSAIGNFIKGTIDGILSVFKPFGDVIMASWNTLFTALQETWQKFGPSILGGIQEFALNVVKTFQLIFDNVLKPIIEPFLAALKEAWQGGLKDTLVSVFDFVATVVKAGLDIYNKFIFPLMQFILQTFKPAWEALGKGIALTLTNTISVVSGFVSGVFQLFRGIIDFVAGIFTGNWQRAWDGVKNIFMGVVNALVSLFKIPLNNIIDTLNSFFRRLGNIAIPDWVPGVGGRSFSIPTIPRLATGTNLVSNDGLAFLHKNEAVIPAKANPFNPENNNQGTQSNPQTIIVKLGEETIFEKVIDYINDKTMRSNETILQV